MRKLTINSINTQVEVAKWGIYIDGNRNLNDVIHENLEQGIFRARISIVIEEIEDELIINSNKPVEVDIDENE